MPKFNPDKNIFRSPKFRSVVSDAIDFLNNTLDCPLPPTGKFIGTGCYALYYSGDFKEYQKLKEREKKPFTLPIYTGKAVPIGWRKARTTTSMALS